MPDGMCVHARPREMVQFGQLARASITREPQHSPALMVWWATLDILRVRACSQPPPPPSISCADA
jgi:hypothetical protein